MNSFIGVHSLGMARTDYQRIVLLPSIIAMVRDEFVLLIDLFAKATLVQVPF